MSECCRFCDVGLNPDGRTISCPKYDAGRNVHCPTQCGFGPGAEGEIRRMQYETWWLGEYSPAGLQNSLSDIRENGT